MSKSNKKSSAGINIQAKEVNVGGDIIGGNKIINQDMQPTELAEANRLATSILDRLSRLENVEKGLKEKLVEQMQDLQNDISSDISSPTTVASKLKSFQDLLMTVQGIGTTGIGIYTLVENLLRLFPK